MFKKLIIIGILFELGVFGYFFQRSSNETERTDPSFNEKVMQTISFVNGENTPINNSEDSIEESDVKIVNLLNSLINELDIFYKLQKEMFDTNMYEDLFTLQTTTNEESEQRLEYYSFIKEFIDKLKAAKEDENHPLYKFYSFLEDEVKKNEAIMRNKLENPDSLDEKRVADTLKYD